MRVNPDYGRRPVQELISTPSLTGKDTVTYPLAGSLT